MVAAEPASAAAEATAGAEVAATPTTEAVLALDEEVMTMASLEIGVSTFHRRRLSSGGGGCGGGGNGGGNACSPDAAVTDPRDAAMDAAKVAGGGNAMGVSLRCLQPTSTSRKVNDADDDDDDDDDDASRDEARAALLEEQRRRADTPASA
mmetsp:Transcript_76265/g.191995  ORF Transcript_76265/g.191995 Transcript_76265/m.191995 type:complete len:151 (+) Transcript_76265:610-1062(+)